MIKFRLLCFFGLHDWTGKEINNVRIMQYWTGANEGCRRCGKLR